MYGPAEERRSVIADAMATTSSKYPDGRHAEMPEEQMMPGSGLDVDELCGRCRSWESMPRYVGPLARRARELDRAISRQLDSADGAALDELWRTYLSARCVGCGSYLAGQWVDAREP